MLFKSEKQTFKEYYPYLIKYKGFFTMKMFEGLFDEIDQLEERITEGDGRYFALWDDSIPLFFMIISKGILETKEKVKQVSPLREKNKQKLKESSWNHVQYSLKIILTNILENLGFDGFEYETIKISGGRLDVYAIHPSTKIQIIGECGPCRLSKIVESLKRGKTELWHLDKEFTLWRYQRGPNWDKSFKIYLNIERKQMQSLFDQMNKIDKKNLFEMIK